MMQYVLIGLAAISNVALNLSLKELSRGLETGSVARLAATTLLSPWFWAAGISGVLLIGLFMAAIRQGSVAVTYIGVTAMAMVLLTIAAAVLHGDVPGLWRIAGLGLIVVGLGLTLAG
ncbi:hypothetical protein [Gemmobacter serpentinus]|uniref:hypothetical protein n=1 Tax=Gemmobacter serpentinus TaxID=2652247 RepID=UPI00124C8337|nr:hypothetical protein [Gemmobacter serpentinus]